MWVSEKNKLSNIFNGGMMQENLVTQLNGDFKKIQIMLIFPSL